MAISYTPGTNILAQVAGLCNIVRFFCWGSLLARSGYAGFSGKKKAVNLILSPNFEFSFGEVIRRYLPSMCGVITGAIMRTAGPDVHSHDSLH